MKIRVTEIGPLGLTIKDTLPLEPLNNRMNEGSNNDIIFTTEPLLDLKVNKSVNGAEIKGKVSANYRQGCGLCLDPLERKTEVAVNFALKPRPARATEEGRPYDEPDDDEGIVYFDGEHIDLEDLIQESLILSLSLHWHPPLKQDGTCSQCKLRPLPSASSSAENTVNFAELLKKAGIKN